MRLIAEGQVKRWSVPDRIAWGQKEHEKVLRGENMLPEGIGLGYVHRESLREEQQAD